ncbi:biopolymer transporter ExbD [Paraburkholderia sp. Ac-20340]|uniref:ExbD/TolR family protein n=1 Tax=Paraburkholderia sp. Ac-20340 TaxID=2703888 RepID=UPI001981D783|nr:biopolymer transporter ExbD [Paraburkholderia sp. Ac-20340]MBN3854924.1 biopolymer transporter ExbD [Paraburkholderia sp. Ac-20340]
MKYFEARKARIEIIPMIDIMFFLLVFFIMITLHMIPNAGLATKLPSSSTAQSLPPPKLTVTLTDDGALSVDGHTLTPAQLTAQLAAQPDAAHMAVTIAGASGARLQYLVAAMDACRAAGVTQVALAAQPVAK